VFGDVALLFNSPRTASVVASSDVVLAAMDRATFLQFVMRHAQARGGGEEGGGDGGD
jgi:cGMP-dependent protein kinase